MGRLVTDRIKNGNIQVQYCPTKQMIADYMSKPLQGALFYLFRNVIMGWSHISSVFEGYVPPEERVELDTAVTKSKLVELKKTYASSVRNQNNRVEVDLAEDA